MNTQSLKIAVLTSGGDAPGMNAAIRAVVRTAIHYDIPIYGVYYGYQGLIEDQLIKLHSNFVANIIQRGGTALKTARSQAFMTEKGRALAYQNMKAKNINALIVIGGDGTFRGAKIFSEQYPIQSIGIPATIDKDILGTEYTIGFDTALNTAVEAIDRIRDTAESHNRLFIVEVMGRDAGYIALYSGIAAGATEVFIPETHTEIANLGKLIAERQKRKKDVHIIVVAEGMKIGENWGGANAVAELIKPILPNFDIRVTILGHIQRGGRPSAMDRIIASRMGNYAVELLLKGKAQVSVGMIKNELVSHPFTRNKEITPINIDIEQHIKMLRILSN